MSKNNTILLPDNIKKHLPSMVKNELSKLPASKQEEFIEEYKRKSKNLSMTYFIFFFFGMHYLYLGKLNTQLLYWFTLAGVSVWWFIDIFRIPSLVEDYNRDVAIDTLRNLKAVSI